MSAPTAPKWLRHQYHEDAARVWVGDHTPWGEVTAVTESAFGTSLTVGSDTWHLESGRRVPLCRMISPETRDVPPGCIR